MLTASSRLDNFLRGTGIDVIVLGLLAILYGYVGYTSFGYDDEMGNIGAIEQLGLHAIRMAQSNDVHPPGQYLINWTLYHLLHDWRFVRLFTALIAAGMLAHIVRVSRVRYGTISAVSVFFLLGLNPAVLMWCTGLRWYAYFVPLLIWLSVPASTSGWRHWLKCFGGLVVLGYIGYAVFVVGPGLVAIYWMRDKSLSRRKIRQALLCALLAFVVYLPQVIIFLTVHYPNREQQVSSLLHNVSGYAIAQLSNQGVFPLSAPGILSMVGMSGLSILAVHSCVRRRTVSGFGVAYGILIFLTLATGLAGKFRNLVVASPWQSLWLAGASNVVQNGRAFAVSIALVGIANIWGVTNVARHVGTTKNNWNLPIADLLAAVDAENANCRGDIAVLTHDPTITQTLKQRGYVVFGPHNGRMKNTKLQGHCCTLVVKTFAGSLDGKTIALLYAEIDRLQVRQSGHVFLGRDAAFRMKRRIDTRFPEFAIEVVWYRDDDGCANVAN